jgi:predicted MFS family arabinose efflux permease
MSRAVAGVARAGDVTAIVGSFLLYLSGSLPDRLDEMRASRPTATRRAKTLDVRSARRAITLVFALHGGLAGSFFTRIPWISDHLGLSPARLGIALVFPAVGGCATMPLAGRILHRLGERAAVRTLLMAMCACVALPALAPSLPALCAALFLFGAAAAMTDVVMNANGVHVQERLGRSIMSGLHGMWSVGTLVASAAGALAAHAGLDARVHLGAVSALSLLISFFACRNLLDTRPDPRQEPPPRFALPARSVLPIGLVGFCAIFAEGASADWSGVYLKHVAGASAGVAAASYTAFACMMAAARLGGDLVIRRLGPSRTVRIGGVAGVAGCVLIVFARSPVPAIAGFALVGIGIAVVVPLAFSAAGKSGTDPGRSIAGMATIIYAASLIAPGTIGGIAGATSLPVSFGLITVLLAVMTARAGVLRSAAPAQRREPKPMTVDRSSA